MKPVSIKLFSAYMLDYVDGHRAVYSNICVVKYSDGSEFEREYCGIMECHDPYQAAIMGSLVVIKSIRQEFCDSAIELYVNDGHTKNIMMLEDDTSIVNGGKWLIKPTKHLETIKEIRDYLVRFNNIRINAIQHGDKIKCLDSAKKYLDKLYDNKYDFLLSMNS